MKPYRKVFRADNNEYWDMYKKLHPIKERVESVTFDENKPLTLPEFNLNDGLLRDIIESKSK